MVDPVVLRVEVVEDIDTPGGDGGSGVSPPPRPGVNPSAKRQQDQQEKAESESGGDTKETTKLDPKEVEPQIPYATAVPRQKTAGEIVREQIIENAETLGGRIGGMMGAAFGQRRAGRMLGQTAANVLINTRQGQAAVAGAAQAVTTGAQRTGLAGLAARVGGAAVGSSALVTAGVALGALTVAILATTRAMKAFRSAVTLVDEQISRASDINPQVAAALAVSDFREFQGDIRRGALAGRELASFIGERAEFRENVRDMRTSLTRVLLPTVTNIYRVLNTISGPIATVSEFSVGTLQETIANLFQAAISQMFGGVIPPGILLALDRAIQKYLLTQDEEEAEEALEAFFDFFDPQQFEVGRRGGN